MAIAYAEADAAPAQPVTVTDADFEAAVGRWPAVVVDLWAEWCGPCKMIAPVLDELAQEYAGKVTVVKLDVDHNPTAPMKYGVRGIPTLLMFKDGELVDQHVGAAPKQQMQKIFQELLS